LGSQGDGRWNFRLPLFALWSIFSELRFGLQAQRLAERLQAEGVPELALEFRPSGRATKDSAAKEFERVSAELNETETWQLWFHLAKATTPMATAAGQELRFARQLC
jgi:hypothetical protein